MAITNICKRKYELSFDADDTVKEVDIDFNGEITFLGVKTPLWTNDVLCYPFIVDDNGFKILTVGAVPKGEYITSARPRLVDKTCKIKIELESAPGGSGGKVIIVLWGKIE